MHPAETIFAPTREPALKRPLPTIRGSQYRVQQIAGIICYLRDQLRVSHPQLIMPSQWLVRNLVANALSYEAVDLEVQNTEHEAEPRLWHQELKLLLGIIIKHCDVGLEGRSEFVLADSQQALFPNAEHFEEWDAVRFSQALLFYLDKEFAAE